MHRVVQISDTHLSPTKRHFACNWEPLTDWLATQRPDLVVHTGDVTVDGAGTAADFAHCSDLLDTLDVPVLSIPGNHDVGEAYHPHQPVNDERLARWRAHIGDDFWVRDLESWRLIGLNSMLFGSDAADEQRQLAWLDRQIAEAQGRRLGWFLHRPLFVESPDEGDKGYWSVPPRQRAHLLDLVRRHDVAFVASGHLHRAHDFVVEGTRYIWGPSCGFVVGPDMQPGMAGSATLGAVTYDFEGRDYTAQVQEISGLKTLWIDDVIHEVYPAPVA